MELKQELIGFAKTKLLAPGEKQTIDGRLIRRAAIDNNVAVFTCLDTVKVLLDVLEEITMGISVIDKE